MRGWDGKGAYSSDYAGTPDVACRPSREIGEDTVTVIVCPGREVCRRCVLDEDGAVSAAAALRGKGMPGPVDVDNARVWKVLGEGWRCLKSAFDAEGWRCGNDAREGCQGQREEIGMHCINIIQCDDTESGAYCSNAHQMVVQDILYMPVSLTPPHRDN